MSHFFLFLLPSISSSFYSFFLLFLLPSPSFSQQKATWFLIPVSIFLVLSLYPGKDCLFHIFHIFFSSQVVRIQMQWLGLEDFLSLSLFSFWCQKTQREEGVCFCRCQDTNITNERHKKKMYTNRVKVHKTHHKSDDLWKSITRESVASISPSVANKN